MAALLPRTGWTFDTQLSGEIDVLLLVRGPILVSMGDLSGYEFGTWVRNPYQRLSVRKPNEVIAHSIAVFYGDPTITGTDGSGPHQPGQGEREK